MADDVNSPTDVVQAPPLLGPNGRPARSLGKRGDFVTRGDVERLMENVINAVILPEVQKRIEHYMRQIPELNARMIGDAFAANGLEFKPPMTTEQMPDQPSTLS